MSDDKAVTVLLEKNCNILSPLIHSCIWHAHCAQPLCTNQSCTCHKCKRELCMSSPTPQCFNAQTQRRNTPSLFLCTRSEYTLHRLPSTSTCCCWRPNWGCGIHQTDNCSLQTREGQCCILRGQVDVGLHQAVVLCLYLNRLIMADTWSHPK